jgi:hypothetical protein
VLHQLNKKINEYIKLKKKNFFLKKKKKKKRRRKRWLASHIRTKGGRAPPRPPLSPGEMGAATQPAVTL